MSTHPLTTPPPSHPGRRFWNRFTASSSAFTPESDLRQLNAGHTPGAPLSTASSDADSDTSSVLIYRNRAGPTPAGPGQPAVQRLQRPIVPSVIKHGVALPPPPSSSKSSTAAFNFNLFGKWGGTVAREPARRKDWHIPSVHGLSREVVLHEDDDADDDHLGTEPLDGEEGEVIDEGISLGQDDQGRVDFLASLPSEISLYILLFVDIQTVCRAQAVSKTWKALAGDNVVWRDHFYQQRGWKIRPDYLATALNQDGVPTTRSRSVSSRSLSRSASQPRDMLSPSPSKTSAVHKLGRRLSDLISDLGGLGLIDRRGVLAQPDSPAPPPAAEFINSRSPPTVGHSPYASRRPSAAAAPVPFGPVPAPVLHLSPTTSLKLHWPRLYRDRFILQERWRLGHNDARALRGHTDSVYCIQADPVKVITGSRDKTIKVWDIDTLECVRTIIGHAGSVLCLQFDHSILCTGSSDCQVIVWDINTFELLFRLKGHTNGVLNIAFADSFIATCSKDASIRIWHRGTGEEYRCLQGHRGPVNAIQFKDDRVASASGDSLIKLWNIHSGNVERIFVGHDRGLACLQWSGDLLASGSNDHTIRIWRVSTGECLRTLVGHSHLLRQMQALRIWTPCPHVSLTSNHAAVRVWDTDTGDQLVDYRKGHTNSIFHVSMSCSRIFSSSADAKVIILDFSTRGIDISPFE